MPTGINLTDGQVRSIFAIRAEGKSMVAIADTMEMSGSVVSRVLQRKTYGHVSINQSTLDAIKGCTFTVYKKRGQYKTRRPPINGTKGGGVIQQAAKAAETTPDSGVPAHRELTAADTVHIPQPKTRPSVPNLTKAEALMDVLNSVRLGNQQRQRAEELRHEAHSMEAVAKRTEDATFTKLTALHELGFSEEFLNSLLTESGMCTDGKFTVE